MRPRFLRLAMTSSLLWIFLIPPTAASAQSKENPPSPAPEGSTKDKKDPNKAPDNSKNDQPPRSATTPTISDMQPAAPLNVPNQTVVLMGKDFQDKATVTFQDPQGKLFDLTADQVVSTTATKIVVTVTFGAAGKWKVHVANLNSPPSADRDFAVALYPTVNPLSPSIKSYRKVFWVITVLLGALFLAVLVFLIAYMVTGRWSLGSALSEEAAYQPDVITNENGKNNVIMVASTSRLIALLGLLGILTAVLGISYAIIWNLFIYGTVPPLSEVRSFLFGAACLFVPYLANQVRSAFDSGPSETTAKTARSASTEMITGVTPSCVLANAASQQIQITGVGFRPSPTITLTDPSGVPTTLPPAQILSAEPSLITINPVLGSAGNWKVTVQNRGAEAFKPIGFSVGGKPVVQRVDGDVHANAAEQDINFVGSGFRQGLTATLTSPNGTNVPVVSTTFLDDQHLRVRTVVNEVNSNWQVRVNNPGPVAGDQFRFSVIA